MYRFSVRDFLADRQGSTFAEWIVVGAGVMIMGSVFFYHPDEGDWESQLVLAEGFVQVE